MYIFYFTVKYCYIVFGFVLVIFIFYLVIIIIIKQLAKLCRPTNMHSKKKTIKNHIKFQAKCTIKLLYIIIVFIFS